ncbi:MAG: methyltransferase domain-containing protein [Magnetococcales bacterium]|nr:methyltransferase domain-containing protein [Magnetococcales bacterium]
MKTTVNLEEVQQRELRPREQYEEYARLLEEDGKRFLEGSRQAWLSRPCPGCGREEVAESFGKQGFAYRRCPGCHTLFISPLPAQADLERVAREGGAARFRRELFSGSLSESRWRNIFQSQLQWIAETVDESPAALRRYADYRSDGSDWLRRVEGSRCFDSILAIAPLTPLAGGSNLTPEVVAGFDEVAEEGLDCLSLFNCLEKVHDPAGVLVEAVRCLRENGLLFIITSAASGFEYLLLRELAPNLLPLDRLTLFSAETIQRLLEGLGLEVVEVSTPGLLDVEMVAHVLRERPEVKIPFWDYFFRQRGDERALADLQLYLQENRLSSYMRIAARKGKKHE